MMAAMVEKMSIMGIRSFSPHHECSIEFYSPLTMIVGANGCGKTTIIECLKYACTGSLPPNVQMGKNFINDPSITDSIEVKANIKLRFRNKSGTPCVVVRTLNVTKKKTKLEFKALDGVVMTTNALGDKVSMSVKCSELDKQIPELLGVSAAIMENVIFLHQEDSNWPMSEGAVLKKKFDDVFESTRYAKALEAFSKSKKDYASKSKELKGELMELGAHLEAARATENELEACRTQEETGSHDLDSLSDRVNQCDERIANIKETIARLDRGANERKELQWRLTESDNRVKETRAKMEEFYANESDEDLLNMIQNCDQDTDSKKKQLSSLQKKNEELKKELTEFRNKLSEMNVQKGSLDMIEKQRNNIMAQQESHIIACARDMKIPIDPKAIDVNSVLSILKLKIKQMQDEFNESVAPLRKEVEASVAEIAATKVDITRANIDCENKVKTIENLQIEWEKKRQELSELTSARHMQKECSREYEDALNEYERFESTVKGQLTNIKSQIKEYENEIRRITDLYNADAEVLRDINMNRNAHAQLNATQKQLIEEHAAIVFELEGLMTKHRDMLSAGVSTPQSEAELDSLVTSLTNEASRNRETLVLKKQQEKDVSNELVKAGTLLDEKKQSLGAINATQKTELTKYAPKIEKIVSKVNGLLKLYPVEFEKFAPLSITDSIDKIVQQTKNVVFTMIETSTSNNSLCHVYWRFKERLDTTNQCPCCEHPLDSVAKSRVGKNVLDCCFLTEEPSKSVAQNDAHNADVAKEAFDEAVELKCVRGKAADANITELNESITHWSAKKAELLQEEQRMKAETDRLELVQKKYDAACKDFSALHKGWKAYAAKNRDFEDKRVRQSQSISRLHDTDNRSAEDIEEDQRRRQLDKDDLQNKKEKKLQEEASLLRRQNQLNTLKLEKENAKKTADIKGARFQELESEISNIKQQEVAADGAKRVHLKQVDDLTEKLKETENKNKILITELKQREATQEGLFTAASKSFDTISRYQSSLLELTKSAPITPEQLSQQMENIVGLINKDEDDIKNLLPRITSLDSELSFAGRRQRIVQDNLDYRKLVKECDSISVKLKEIEKQVGGTEEDYRRYERELQKFNQDKIKLCSDRDRLLGNIEVFRQQCKALELKLKSENYRNIDSRYRKKSVEFETTNIAVHDLGIYYDALDQALQSYHSRKLNEINKIIKELWQVIYKGQDIEIIQLESGIDATAGKATKSYNYRVVMKKGNVVLDMRGRCSAGQRVLASIVIRLALAETFCLNCGILALDEPTTNLDEANKQGLAVALARIICARKRQQNFQLICITHDEEFVRAMKEQLSQNSEFSTPEFYFRVSREEDDEGDGKYFSKIERISWDDM